MALAPVTSAAAIMAGMFKYDCAPGAGPMHTVSSASDRCMRSRSALEYTATVLMPISLQARRMRRAISPRLAIRTFSSITGSGSLNDGEQRLVVFDRLAVLNQDAVDGTANFGFNVVHHFHGFNNAKYFAFLHGLSNFNEAGRSW